MYQRILVPVDGSPTSDRGLAEAIGLAKLTGAQIRLMHVVDELSFALGVTSLPSYAGGLIEMLREAGTAILLDATQRVESNGIAVDAVLKDSVTNWRLSSMVAAEAASWSADLVVIGTHGRRGWARLVMGSDAEQILRTAAVPVLLVRSDEPPQ